MVEGTGQHTDLHEVLGRAKQIVIGRTAQILEAVLNKRVLQEEEGRQAILLKALDKLKTAEKESAKAGQADQVSYNEQGAVISSTFSKAAAEKNKKAKDALLRVQTALLDVYDRDDWGKIIKMFGDGAGTPPAPEEDEKKES